MKAATAARFSHSRALSDFWKFKGPDEDVNPPLLIFVLTCVGHGVTRFTTWVRVQAKLPRLKPSAIRHWVTSTRWAFTRRGPSAGEMEEWTSHPQLEQAQSNGCEPMARTSYDHQFESVVGIGKVRFVSS
ncbi:hypothetical protein V6N13_138407 [Hibiscus sabdariffa]